VRPLNMLPVGPLLVASALTLGGFIAVRYRGRLLTGFAARWLALRAGGRAARERVLILGGGDTGQFAAWLLSRRKPVNALRLVGFLDDDLYKQGERINGCDVIGKCSQVAALVKAHDIGVLIFAIHNIDPRERQRLLELCASTPARLVVLPDLVGALHDFLHKDPVSGRAHAPQEAASPHTTSGGNGHGHAPLQQPGAHPSPCSYCLTHCTPPQVETWLAGLQHTAANGDLPALIDQIQVLRGTLTTQITLPEMASEKFSS
jgi:hypothetical protein